MHTTATQSNKVRNRRRWKVKIRDGSQPSTTTDSESDDDDCPSPVKQTELINTKVENEDTTEKISKESGQQHSTEIELNIQRVALLKIRLPDPVNTQDKFTIPHAGAPTSYKNMLTRADRQLWETAVHQELQSMKDLQVWIPIHRSELLLGTQHLPWNWIFTIKDNVLPKARLVILGSRDHQQYQPSEMYSPVPSSSTIRVLFGLPETSIASAAVVY